MDKKIKTIVGYEITSIERQKTYLLKGKNTVSQWKKLLIASHKLNSLGATIRKENKFVLLHKLAELDDLKSELTELIQSFASEEVKEIKISEIQNLEDEIVKISNETTPKAGDGNPILKAVPFSMLSLDLSKLADLKWKTNRVNKYSLVSEEKFLNHLELINSHLAKKAVRNQIERLVLKASKATKKKSKNITKGKIKSALKRHKKA